MGIALTATASADTPSLKENLSEALYTETVLREPGTAVGMFAKIVESYRNAGSPAEMSEDAAVALFRLAEIRDRDGAGNEAPMRLALEQSLRSEGFKVASAADGEAGLELGCSEPFDLILLDVMMPKLDGYAVCRGLRKHGCNAPVLMLTAKGLVDDRVTGLESGADDYLTKPFSLKELLARVHALLRRFQRSEPIADPYPIGDAEIHFSKRQLLRLSQTHELSEKEIGMLKLLIEADGEPVSR